MKNKKQNEEKVEFIVCKNVKTRLNTKWRNKTETDNEAWRQIQATIIRSYITEISKEQDNNGADVRYGIKVIILWRQNNYRIQYLISSFNARIYYKFYLICSISF
jgi:hypothetical protein